MAKQDGLEWRPGTFGMEPRWTAEPNIAKVEIVARKHLKIEQIAYCGVTYYAQGAFNKLYKIETEAGCSLMRVTLPVDPSNKTNSEVATILFVGQNTDIPIPRIFAFDDSRENELGFEWMLMEMLPGVTLRTRWRKLSRDAKRDLVKEVAKYEAQLFRYKFPVIGNMFLKPGAQLTSYDSAYIAVLADTQPAQEENQQLPVLPVLGQLVSMVFFWGHHITQDVPRGPFTNSEDWIRARLTLVLTDQERILKTSDDEDDMEEAEDAKTLATKLLELLPSIFPSDTCSIELSMLCHNDLSMQNILVDSDGRITGVVDWECVSALPLWRACGMPTFLQGRDRIEEPKRDQYSPDNDDEDTIDVDDTIGPTKKVLDNEGVDSLYWEHLLEYELTVLREVFQKEMGILAPRWFEESEKGAVKADFEEAVQNCDNSWRTKRVRSWLDALEKGNVWDLRRSFLE
ncbi:Altered inheritance of mitochondria protein, mitochondrial [Lachnellula subtilissima]|uniref:Altered inheritance of mitochondria protein, mitochondrial n=1 Tax=Lachnellula subtilissima TaxID=602034 RepID=A0A8H8U6Y7_9HELO|nr:Altered inheritance of mitochondria protein, mitochondrial [Lachnellula subtilissima]